MNSCRSISVVIRVPKREDGIDLLVVETSGRHLRLADLPIVVGIKLPEGRLDFLKSLESLAHPCDNSGCGWTHDSDKFRYINFTIVVDVSKGKDCINLLGRELLSTVPHLLLADHPIPVLVKNPEKLLSSLMFLTALVIMATAAVALGHIRPMNSSKSISPSPLTSPRMKMASTSWLLNLPHLAISERLILPSLSTSILRKAFLTSLMLLNCEEILAMTVSAEGHITPMNSSRSIAPSSLTSPRAKMDSICSWLDLCPDAPISCLVIEPSPSASSILKADFTSSMFLNELLSFEMTSVAEGYIRPMNSPMSRAPSPFTSPRAKMALTSSWSYLEPEDESISCLLRRPSLSVSILLKVAFTSWMLLKEERSLARISEADGLIRATNSCRDTSPSPSESPRLKMASTSMSL